MRGAIQPLPQYAFMSWCLVKHRDNFTFTSSQLIYSFDIQEMLLCQIEYARGIIVNIRSPAYIGVRAYEIRFSTLRDSLLNHCNSCITLSRFPLTLNKCFLMSSTEICIIKNFVVSRLL
jgi:hypothetical protein